MAHFAKVICSLIFVSIFLTACGEKGVNKQAQKPTASSPVTGQTEVEKMAAKKELQKANIATIASKVSDQTVDLSAIQGRKLSGLYSDILAINPGIVPKSAIVNYGEQTAEMWERKLYRKKGVSDSTTDNSHTPIAVYVENPKK